MDSFTILLEAISYFFLIVGLFAAAIGLILMLAPKGYEQLATRMNRDWSTRRAMRDLEIPHYYERFFFRHHRWVGILLLVGCGYFFFAFVTRLSPAEAAAGLPGPAALLWAWEGLFWFLVVANLVAAILAFVILIRPSALKPLETMANRWISVRQATRGMEREHDEFDRFARRHHRGTGFVLLLGGIFLMVSFWLLLTQV